MKPMGATAAPWRIAQCPSCGFVHYKKEFADSEKVRLREIAWVLLQASWQVESDKGRYTTCLQEAVHLLDSVVVTDLTTDSFADTVAAPTDAHVAAYLCIELNRLMGDFSKAEQYLALMRPRVPTHADRSSRLRTPDGA